MGANNWEIGATIAHWTIAILTAIIMVFGGIELNHVVHQTQATTQLAFYKHYTDLVADGDKARRDSCDYEAQIYYRENLDMVYAEYQIWKKDGIDDDVMYTWSRGRSKMFVLDDSIITKDTTTHPYRYSSVTFKSVWEKLRNGRGEYFGDLNDKNNDFIRFMDTLAAGKMDDPSKLQVFKK